MPLKPIKAPMDFRRYYLSRLFLAVALFASTAFAIDYTYTRTVATVPKSELVRITVETSHDSTVVSTFDSQSMTRSLFRASMIPVACEVRNTKTGLVTLKANLDQAKQVVTACGKTISAKANTYFNLGSLLWVFGSKRPAPGKVAQFHLVNPSGDLAFDTRLMHKGLDTVVVAGKRIPCNKYEMDLLGIAKFFWPYTYRYWYDARKGYLVAYEGPDTLKRLERLVITELN